MDRRSAVNVAILETAGHREELLEADGSILETALLPAATASMAAVLDAGCRSVADFFASLSKNGGAREGGGGGSQAHMGAAVSMKIIILASYEPSVTSLKAQDIPECLGWDTHAVRYLRDQIPHNPICVFEDATLKWGEDALLFLLSTNQWSKIVSGGLLSAIPPFATLCLAAASSQMQLNVKDFCTVLASPNFTHLCLLVDPDFATLGLETDMQEALLSNTSLLSLFIGIMWRFGDVSWIGDAEWLGSLRALASHPSLTSLSIFNFWFRSPHSIEELFSSELESNLTLTSLCIESDYFSYGCFEQATTGWSTAATTTRNTVLDSLRRHGTLHQVDLYGTPLRADAVISAQLRKNAQNAARVQLFKSQGGRLVRPSTIRLYLCGLPLSGKTTISRSLASWSKGSLHRWRRHKGIKLSDRTRGIAVTVVESQETRQRMSIWDMAGQVEYHSFHDSMLPDLGDRAIPSLFLFIWNPFETDAYGQLLRDAEGNKVKKGLDRFRNEFKYWLKFLASKCPKSNNIFKPKVVVAISRADLGLPNMRLWLESTFKSLQEEFEEYIHIDMEGLFEVDSRNPKMISELASHLFVCAKAILKDAPDDFKICDDARNLFGDWIQRGQIPPLITKERFFLLCQKYLGIEKEMCEAVALSLNSSGNVIFFPSLELVVMDTQWFCQKVMGDFLHFNMKSSDSQRSDGFYPLKLLQKVLEEEMNSRRGSKWKFSMTRDAGHKIEESWKVAGDDLVRLLMGLELACPRDYTVRDSDIFLPTSLCGKARGRVLPNKYLKLDGSFISYIGRRWTVRDFNCTFLTPGIFPRLQVTFHNMLTSRHINVELEQDIIAFGFAGARVLMEFCTVDGFGNFIDILVCSCHTLDEGLEWVQENVITEMMEVFADPRGIPGVDLTQSVIQPACIAGLMEASQRPAVPIQVLRAMLREHVEKKGAKLTEDGIKSVMYTWQTKTLADDSVVSLLGEAEVVKIIQAYRSSLSEVARDVLNLTVEAEETTSNRKRLEFGTSPSQKQREAIYNLLCDFRVEMKAGMKQLAQQVEDMRGAVLPKLCELFTFIEEGEAGKLPRIFVVTENDGLVHRVVVKMVPGLHKLRLELLCECRGQPAHLVDAQHGLSISTLDDGLLKRGLPYIHAVLKVATVVTKIGAHAALGYSGLIPDFTAILGDIVNAADFGPPQPFSSLTADWNSSSRLDFRNGQQWLFDVLSHNDCTRGEQIYAHFGLRRIRYANSTVAWVCDKHYSGGTPWPA